MLRQALSISVDSLTEIEGTDDDAGMAVVENQSALRRLRQSNVERVLAQLRAHGPQSRAEVARRTGLSRTTLSGILGRLLAQGTVTEEAEPHTKGGGRGRPVRRLSLNPHSAHAIGIEIGRERVQAVIADAAHEVKAAGGTHCPSRADARSRARTAVALVRDIARREGIDLRAVTVAGVGTPGPGRTAEHDSATPTGGTGPGDTAVPRQRQIIADTVSHLLDVSVLADNNSRLTALGEAIWGAAHGAADVLYVALSHGVGGGLVVNSRLFRGAYGAAGEVGHISVDPGGAKCWCGGHGCMELSASVHGLLRAAGRRSWPRFREALDSGEVRARAAADHAAVCVGRALAAACNTVNPERIVLGGEVADLGPVFLEPVEAAFRYHCPYRVHHGISLVPASLEDRGGALGALALVLQESPLLAGYAPPPTGRFDSYERADTPGDAGDADEDTEDPGVAGYGREAR